MLPLLIAAIIVFCFTAVLTVAGVGAAFGVIPFLYWLGFPLKEAMATALLLNCLSMSFASWTFIRNKLVVFRTAIPIVIVASVFSPIGAYCTQFVARSLLLWLFIFSSLAAFSGHAALGNVNLDTFKRGGCRVRCRWIGGGLAIIFQTQKQPDKKGYRSGALRHRNQGDLGIGVITFTVVTSRLSDAATWRA